MKSITKKRIIILTIVIVLIAALFPFRNDLRDGGTAVYEPITKIYRVDDMHRFYAEKDKPIGFTVGEVVYIFGNKVYDSSRVIYDDRINGQNAKQ